MIVQQVVIAVGFDRPTTGIYVAMLHCKASPGESHLPSFQGAPILSGLRPELQWGVMSLCALRRCGSVGERIWIGKTV